MASGFSNTAHTAMAIAKEEAEGLDLSAIGTEHVLTGLMEAGGIAARLLAQGGVGSDSVRAEVENLRKRNAEAQSSSSPSIPMKSVIDHARTEARGRGQDRIGTEHLLLGLLNEREGGAMQVLANLNIDVEELKAGLLHRLDSSHMDW